MASSNNRKNILKLQDTEQHIPVSLKRKKLCIQNSAEKKHRRVTHNIANKSDRVLRSASHQVQQSEFEEGIIRKLRIGKKYQATVPNLISKMEVHFIHDPAILVWKPTDKLDDEEIDSFIKTASANFKYSEQQALVLLCVNNFDLKESEQCLRKYIPVSKL